MKTQIIQLETHDDLISIRDRMAWAKSPRILLVWPRRGEVALRPLDLKLLQRHAAELGAQLGLVTRKAGIRDDAWELGIPVFVSIPEAQRSAWPEMRPTRLKRRQAERLAASDLRDRLNEFHRFGQLNPILRLLVFALGVLAVLSVVVMFVPSAEIVLKPNTKLQQAVIPITASADVEAVYISGSLPARTISLPIEIDGEISASGELLVPESKASGTVRFFNLTATVMSIPAGTVVRTSDLPVRRFVTVEAGEIAPAIDATLDLQVEALEPGAASNLDAGTALILEGVLGLSVETALPSPLLGGSDRRVTAPSVADYASLRTQLLADLGLQALTDLQADMDAGDILIEDTLQSGEILEESFDPPEGTPGSVVQLHLVVEYSATYLSGKDMTELATASLDAALLEGYEAVPDSLSFSGVDTPSLDDGGVLHWQLEAKRLSRPHIELSVVQRLVQGRSTSVASEYLQSYYALLEAPDFHISPAWWPWLPFNPLRMAVNY